MLPSWLVAILGCGVLIYLGAKWHEHQQRGMTEEEKAEEWWDNNGW